MKRLAVLVLLMLPVAAHAEEGRFCPNRPSLGESGCTTEPGRVQFELSGIDWERTTSDDERTDTILAGDLQARIGLSDSAELQVGWTPFGHVRTRDRVSGVVDTTQRVGDVQIGLRQNLRNPDGSGLSFAIEPFVSLPVGRMPVGAGTWGAGMVLPVTYDLSKSLNVALTNEVDAAPDEDGRGRHFMLNEVLGLGYDLSDSVTAVAELQLIRDNDPEDHQTQLIAAGSLAWQPRHGLQFDMLVSAGLNHDAPDVRVVTGGAVLF